MASAFFGIPHEAQLLTCSFLDVTSLRRFSEVCRDCRTVAEDNELWRAFFERSFREMRNQKLTLGWENRSLKLLFRQVRRPQLACTQTLTMRGHRNPLKRLLLDQESGTLYSGQQHSSLSAIAKSWNADTGEPVLSFSYVTDGHGKALAFNPNEKVLYVGDISHGRIYMFCTKTGNLLDTLGGNSTEIVSLAFDPGLNVLFSGSKGGAIKVWDTARKELMTTLAGHQTGTIECFAQDLQQERLYAGSNDGSITVWNTRTREFLNGFQRDDSTIFCLALHQNANNQRVLFAGSEDGHITVWNTETQKGTTYKAHPNAVYCLALGCDDLGQKVLYSGARNDAIKVWDADTQKPLYTLGSHQGLSCNHFVLGKDNALYVACEDGAVRRLSRRTNALPEERWQQLAEDIAKAQFCKFSLDTSFEHRLGAVPPSEKREFFKALGVALRLSDAQKEPDKVTVLAIRLLLHPKLVEIFSEQSAKKKFFDSLGLVIGKRARMKSPEVAFYGDGDDSAFASRSDIEEALAPPKQTQSVIITSSSLNSSALRAQIRQAMNGFSSSTTTTSSASSQQWGKAHRLFEPSKEQKSG